MRDRGIAAFFFAVAFCGHAAAATVGIDVADSDGKPVANAVVSLMPEGAAQIASHLPERATIDQRHETFLPLVVVVRKGGAVIFTNNDVTMHQVYSFAPIKQFQFTIKQGEVSAPVVFDQAGVAAIGCNIHDHMIAYVYVGDAPFAAITDDKGHATIAGVPDGAYRATTWHPQLPIGAPQPQVTLTVSGDASALTAMLPFSVMPERGMKHMHMDY